jgi:hypothetical protein
VHLVQGLSSPVKIFVPVVGGGKITVKKNAGCIAAPFRLPPKGEAIHTQPSFPEKLIRKGDFENDEHRFEVDVEELIVH